MSLVRCELSQSFRHIYLLSTMGCELHICLHGRFACTNLCYTQGSVSMSAMVLFQLSDVLRAIMSIVTWL